MKSPANIGLASLPRALREFWLAIVALSAASFAFTMACTYLFHLPYPYGPPLFFRGDRWFDFTVYWDRFQLFRQPGFWSFPDYPFTYPAPAAMFYALAAVVPHSLRWYLLAFFGCVGVGALLLVRALVRRGVALPWAAGLVATALAASYPLRVEFESANTEGLVCVLLALGIWLVLRDRDYAGATLIALAGSIKIYPFVLLALLLSRRRYRAFAWGIVVAAGATLASLWALGPSIAEAQRHIDDGILYVKITFIFYLKAAAVNFNHSLFTPVKYAVVLAGRALHPVHGVAGADFTARYWRERALLEHTFTAYVACAALFGIAAYFGRIRRLPMLNQVLALTVCSLLLPPLSADYTLIQLLFPFALLCLYAAERGARPTPGLRLAMLSFAMIFSFMTFFTLRYRFACPVRTLMLCVLLYAVMRWPFPLPQASQQPHPSGLEAAG